MLALFTACGSMGPKPPGSKVYIDPKEALFQEAESLYEQKKFDQAIEIYLEYTSRYTNDELIDAALLKLGIANKKLGKYDQALSYLEELNKTFPDSPLAVDARIEVLAVYLRQGRFRKVEQKSKVILEESLHDTQRLKINKILADSFSSAGNHYKAVQYYDRMLQLTSQKSQGDIFDKVQSVVDQLNMEQTKQLLDNVLGKKICGHLLYHLGKMHFTEKNFTESEAIFRELLTKYPEFREKEDVLSSLDAITSGEAFKSYTLGCLLPLSGSFAAYGQRALRGIEMALIHFSQKTPNLMPKLVVEDTQSSPKQAIAALKVMAKQGVAAVVGPMVTTEQVAIEADAIGVPIITLTQKEYVTDSSPFVFRNFITPEMQVKTLVSFASKTLGAKRFAVLYPNENYGITFMDLFWDEVVVHGGMVAGAESYNLIQTDFADGIKKLVGLYYPMSEDDRIKALEHAAMLCNPEKALQFFQPEEEKLSYFRNKTEEKFDFSDTLDDIVTFMDEDAFEGSKKDSEEDEAVVDFNAVFIPDSPKKVGLIIPQLAFYDIRDVYLLGTNIWHSDSLIRMSRKYLNDAVVVDGFFVESGDYNIQKFVSDFFEIYNEKPEIFAATAYDSALIILNLLRNQTLELRSQIKDYLLNMPPYEGITGKTTFRPNGEVSKDLFVLGVRRGKFIELTRLNPNPANIGSISIEIDNFPDKTKVKKAWEE
jgi:ABC-type branched-subunit amino acid transport system substrate-binding protein